MTNAKEVIQTLKEEAATDQVFADVCHMWTKRMRSRNQVTIKALAQRMVEAGMPTHKPGEYGRVLKVLANLGFGRIEMDRRGDVKALKDIKITLSSIGEVAVGKALSLKSFKLRNRYRRMQVPAPTTPSAVPHKVIRKPEPAAPIGLVVKINEKSVNIPLPDSLSDEEMAGLIRRLRGTQVA
jgi:hypothetical protein